ncbi:hypothetical protein AXA44_15475 [Rhodococcus sp. SC4]|nr:hypothetical protein AXA44_15475 [Rhodococcus sp. SC4]
MIENYLTLTQALKYCGVGERTLKRAVSDGSLRAYRVGPRLLRFDPADLDAWAVPVHPDADAVEEHVRRVLAQAPPLTDEQRQRISALLSGAEAGAR